MTALYLLVAMPLIKGNQKLTLSLLITSHQEENKYVGYQMREAGIETDG